MASLPPLRPFGPPTPLATATGSLSRGVIGKLRGRGRFGNLLWCSGARSHTGRKMPAWERRPLPAGARSGRMSKGQEAPAGMRCGTPHLNVSTCSDRCSRALPSFAFSLESDHLLLRAPENANAWHVPPNVAFCVRLRPTAPKAMGCHRGAPQSTRAMLAKQASSHGIPEHPIEHHLWHTKPIQPRGRDPPLRPPPPRHRSAPPRTGPCGGAGGGPS